MLERAQLRPPRIDVPGYSGLVTLDHLSQRDDLILLWYRTTPTHECIIFVDRRPRQNHGIDVKIAASPTYYIFTFPSNTPPTLDGLISAYTSRFPPAFLPPTRDPKVFLVDGQTLQYAGITSEQEWEKYGWAKAKEVFDKGKRNGEVRMASFNLLSAACVVYSPLSSVWS
ncbi:hypothetical protein JCM8547_005113 [Rhodosporidiobolus lusitaniae]